MARITVEDCEKVVPNKFELVILAAQRTRQILAGDKITIEDKKDEKKPVIALREIAERTVSPENLKNRAIEQFRSFVLDEADDEDLDELMAEDTYSPYTDLETQELEKDGSLQEGMSIVDSDGKEELESAGDNDEDVNSPKLSE